MEMAIPPRHVGPCGVRRLFRGPGLELQHQSLARVGLQPLRELLLRSLIRKPFDAICERNHASGTSLFPETKNL